MLKDQLVYEPCWNTVLEKLASAFHWKLTSDETTVAVGGISCLARGTFAEGKPEDARRLGFELSSFFWTLVGMGGNGEQVEVDRIWTSLGPWGRYQIKQYISYCLICISWVIHQLTIVFIGYRPNFHCKAGLNDSLIANKTGAIFEYGECKVERYENTSTGMVKTTSECQHGWTYDIPTDQSFVSEWDFVCEKEELAEMTQLLLFVGMIIGTCFFPTMSDRFGRKPVMVFSHICLFAIVLATSFSPNYTTFVVLRILTGAVTQGALSGTTLASETFPKECRHLTEVFALVVWTSSICIMSPIAYALRNVSWRYLQITFALMSAWSLLQWWFLDESLRWLIANGKMDQARKIIRKACRYNRKDYHTVLKDSGLDEGGDEHVRLSKDGGALQLDAIAAPTPIPDVFVEKYTICDMFKNKMIRNVSFIIWYTWIVDSLVYYGLYMISSDLYGDRYINFFLSALIEYPASVFEYFALVKIGRKWTCVICHSVAAIALIVATAFRYSADGHEGMMVAGTAFTLIGKMGITGAFSSAFVVTPELYPTNLSRTRFAGYRVRYMRCCVYLWSSCLPSYRKQTALSSRRRWMSWQPGTA